MALTTLDRVKNLPTTLSTGDTTHLRDHGIIALALKEILPLVTSLNNSVPVLAPKVNAELTGTTTVERLTMANGAGDAKVLTSDATGKATWKSAPVTTVAGRSGAVTLTPADVPGVATLEAPVFQGAIQADQIVLNNTQGGAGAGKVLTSSNETGSTEWAEIILSGASLPTAGTATAGTLFRQIPASGTESLHICLGVAGGTYAWKKLA